MENSISNTHVSFSAKKRKRIYRGYIVTGILYLIIALTLLTTSLFGVGYTKQDIDYYAVWSALFKSPLSIIVIFMTASTLSLAIGYKAFSYREEVEKDSFYATIGRGTIASPFVILLIVMMLVWSSGMFNLVSNY